MTELEEILLAALEYYAKEENYKEQIVGYNMVAPIENDKGKVARKALNDFTKANNPWAKDEYFEYPTPPNHVPSSPNGSTFISVNGKRFYCEEKRCKSNMFTKMLNGKYSCNGCGAVYIGE